MRLSFFTVLFTQRVLECILFYTFSPAFLTCLLFRPPKNPYQISVVVAKVGLFKKLFNFDAKANVLGKRSKYFALVRAK